MCPRHSVAAAPLLLVFLLHPPVHAADDAPADLVLVQQGALPIILTVPHGGKQAIPGIGERNIEGRSGGKGGGKWSGYVKGADHDTDILAQGISAEIQTLTGKAPYMVMAKFQRKYVDANRPPEIGLDNPNARPYYDYYHDAVRRFIAEVRSRYPAALLIDVHGQSDDPQRGHARHGQRPHDHAPAAARRRAGHDRA